jgi:hypothetical protein
MADSQRFVSYWLGYANNNVTLPDIPEYVNVVNLFLVNLYPDTALNTNYITSDGMSWDQILQGAKTLQQRGTKVLASIMSTPNPPISWNTIADPAAFASQVKSLVVDQWGLDGIDIDPEIGDSEAPNDTFIQVVKELSAYFGPASGTGKMMTYVSYQLGNDQTLLQDSKAYFDYVALMGYFWDYDTMISQFEQYAAIVGNEMVLFGVSPGGGAVTPIDEVKQLAQWQPSGGSKGGMMLFNINGDTNFSYASTINQNMGATAQASGKMHA